MFLWLNKIKYLLIVIFLFWIIDITIGSFFLKAKNNANRAEKYVLEIAANNSLGYRDIEHSIIGKKGIYRIAILGDSQTWGQSISHENDVYPRVLEGLLNESLQNERFEVFNYSHPGWGTGDELHALIQDGLQYEPDLVFLGYWTNDIPVFCSNCCRSSLEKLLRDNLKGAYSILKKSSAFSSFFDCKSAVGCTMHYGKSYGKCLNNLVNSRGWQLQKIYFDLLDIISRFNNFHLIVGILPFISSSLSDDYPVIEENITIKKFLRDRGIQFIDFYESGFKNKDPVILSRKEINLKNGETIEVPYPEIHFGPSANHLIAQIISDKLKPIKEYIKNTHPLENLSRYKTAELLKRELDFKKDNGNPLLSISYEEQKNTVECFSSENNNGEGICGDPLFFERSWIPYLDKLTGPRAEETIFKSLSFFYFWKEYFDSVVKEVLNNGPTLTFLKALKRVYKDKNEIDKLGQLKNKFNI